MKGGTPRAFCRRRKGKKRPFEAAAKADNGHKGRRARSHRVLFDASPFVPSSARAVREE